MKRPIALSLAVIAPLCAPALADMPHDHGVHFGSADSLPLPQVLGQDTFAAISEIVAILNADPETDWSRVNVGALHRHLLDMDALFTRTSVTDNEIVKGLRITISRRGAGGEAAGRMVPAHAHFLEAQTEWKTTVDMSDETIVWTVTAAIESEAAKIQALGFYGLMATGAHHQRHHLALARGEKMH